MNAEVSAEKLPLTFHVRRQANGWEWRLMTRDGFVMAMSPRRYSMKGECVFSMLAVKSTTFDTPVVYHLDPVHE